MRYLSYVAVAALVGLITTHANADVITFDSSPSHAFADGTFSSGIGGYFSDGFYQTGSSTSAFNGYGQNGEYITFNGPATVVSMDVQQWTTATQFTVTLLDATSNILAAQNFIGYDWQTLTFNTVNVSEILFTFTGGYDAYGIGNNNTAWYAVDNIIYNPGATAAVPEPASMALLGLGLAGLGIVRRRKAA